MQHQGRHRDLLEVVAEIGRTESLHAAQRRSLVGLLAQLDRGLAFFLADLELAVGAEEILGEAIEEGVAILLQAFAHFIGLFLRQRALGVVAGLEHVRRHRRGEHHAVQARFAMLGDIARHFTTAHGEADQGGVLQVQILDHTGQIIGERVVLVAIGRLVRASEATAIVGHHAVARIAQRGNLGLPRFSRQRPAMDQDHRAAGTTGIFNVQANAGSSHGNSLERWGRKFDPRERGLGEP
ncbi:hypothetical protein D3C71_1538280 [compost metagenome]